MKMIYRVLTSSAVLFGVAVSEGCGSAHVRVGYRAYDPYRSDYHVWDGNETRFYSQWTVETHRNPRTNFKRLRRNEQEDYWRWRHDH